MLYLAKRGRQKLPGPSATVLGVQLQKWTCTNSTDTGAHCDRFTLRSGPDHPQKGRFAAEALDLFGFSSVDFLLT